MINTTSCSDREAGHAGWDADWDQACTRGLERAVFETLDRVTENIEMHLHDPHDRRVLLACREDLRQLRGALSMTGFEQGAQLLTEAEDLVVALLDERPLAAGTPRVLMGALQELRSHPWPADPAALISALEALRLCRITDPGEAEPVLTVHGPQHHHGADAAVHQTGEWASGADVFPGERATEAAPEAGRCIAQIKASLETVVQAMPRWWERQRDEQILQTLNRSFALIADRAETLGLGEIAKLAALLERLVERVNDDMISVTVERLYGVIEQGVLKLGILFLQYCRPHGSPRDSRAREKLEGALAGLQMLNSRMDSVAPPGGLRGLPGAQGEPGSQAQWDSDAGVGDEPEAAVPSRLEDLLVEANLLHSQLLPRIHGMRQQQQEIQRELAGLQQAGAAQLGDEGGTRDEGDAPPELAAMASAGRLLARLITECEQCLHQYRRATRELQDAILNDVSRTLSDGHLPAS